MVIIIAVLTFPVISEILRVMDFVHLEALAYLRLDAYAEAAKAENM